MWSASTKQLSVCRLGLLGRRALSSAATPHYDVVIAGGGVMGCSVAYHLAESSNLKIAVAEKDSTYKHASCVLSAGGIRHQFTHLPNIQMSQYGTEFLKSVPERLRVHETHDAPDIQYHEHGYVFLASEKGVDSLHENFATQRAAGANTALLSPADLIERFPWMNTEDVAGATFGLSNEGWFDPWSFLVAMKKKCVSMGVDFLDGHATAFDLDDHKAIKKIHLESRDINDVLKVYRQTISADRFVNAAGCWSSKVLEACGNFDYPVKARKRSIFVFHCPHEDTWKGDKKVPFIVDHSGVYVRREGNGGHFICGVSPAAEDDHDCESVEELQTPSHELFDDVIWPAIANRVKQFEDIKLVNSWAGFYDYNTFDQNAIIGKHPDFPNMYLINGFSGHGLQQSPAAGRAVAELIVHDEYKTIDASCFSYERILENRPFIEKEIV